MTGNIGGVSPLNLRRDYALGAALGKPKLRRQLSYGDK